MTSQRTADEAATTSPASPVLRATGLFALTGGASWTVDTVTIALLNRSFDPLDSVLFFVGFLGLVLTIVGLAVQLSAGWRGRARAGRAFVAFLAVAAVLAAISWTADTLARRVFSPANIGLHDEWSCFSIGVCLLAIAAVVSRRR